MLQKCLTQNALAPRLTRRAVTHGKFVARYQPKGISAGKRATAKRRSRQLRCAEVSGSSLVEKLNAEQLEVAIQDRSLPIVIDFYATWCGPCVLMASELLKVAEELKDKVRILKVDTDENPQLSTQLRIEGLPTLIFLGPPPASKSLRLEGMIPAETVIKIVKEELKG